VKAARELVKRRRGITRFVITETIVVPSRAPRVDAGGELGWVPLARLGDVVLSGPHRRWITGILASGGGADQAPKR
jgi:A/G-specific adenine glycosylase